MPKSLLRTKLPSRSTAEIPDAAKSSRPGPGHLTRGGLTGHAEAPAVRESVRSTETLEEEMLSKETRRELEILRRKKLRAMAVKTVQFLTAFLCVYLVFLIYGVLNTEYTYNERGEIVPVVLTVDSIREAEEFRAMNTQYVQARTLYEKVLLLDYRLGAGAEDPLLIAPEYEKLLEEISSLSVQIGAITVPAKYVQPMNMLLSWVQNDIALYCQFISRAISQDSVTDMNQALAYRETMYGNFRQITQVVATLASRVPGADTADLMNWSPEGYLEQYTGGNP